MKKIFFLFLVMCVILFSSCANLKLSWVKPIDLSGYWSFTSSTNNYILPYEIEYPSIYLKNTNGIHTVNSAGNYTGDNLSFEFKVIGEDEIELCVRGEGSTYEPGLKERISETKGRIISKELIHFYYFTETMIYNDRTEKRSGDTNMWLRKTYQKINSVEDIFKTGTMTINSNYKEFNAGEKYTIELEVIPDAIFPNYSNNATLTLVSKEKKHVFPLSNINIHNEIHNYPEGISGVFLNITGENDSDLSFQLTRHRFGKEDECSPKSYFNYEIQIGLATIEWQENYFY